MPNQSTSSRILSKVLRVIAQLFLLVWALVVTVPLVWVVVTSFKDNAEILMDPWGAPASLRFDNYARAWNQANFGSFFVNTVIVTLIGMVVVLVLSSLLAFTIAKFDFPGKAALRSLFFGVLSFPIALSLMPLFFLALSLNMANSLIGLGIIYGATGIAFTTIFLIAFFEAIPSELVEAARIDGCSYWGAFFRVILPLSRPGLVGVGIFQFMSQWNQYILPLVLITDDDKYVLGLGIVRLAVEQGFRGDWSAMFAGMVLTMLPVLVLYVAFHRQIQKGLTAGAVKL